MSLLALAPQAMQMTSKAGASQGAAGAGGKSNFQLGMQKAMKGGGGGKGAARSRQIMDKYSTAPDMSQYASVGNLLGILNSMQSGQRPRMQAPVMRIGLLGG